jgi:hypothetical protein
VDGLARSALNYMVMTKDNFIPLVWNNWPDQLSPGGLERFSDFYSLSQYPTAVIGGMDTYVGYDCTSMSYEQSYNVQTNISSPIEIELQFDQVETEDFIITADVEITEDITTSDNKIWFVITNWIPYSATEPWYFLVVGTSSAQDFNLNTVGETGSFSAEISVEMSETWQLSDLKAVAIIQNWDSKEILQAAQIQFDSTGIDEIIVRNEFNLRNYPNPFNPSTSISFQLSDDQTGMVDLSIFNVKGQKIKNLVNSNLKSGNHTVNWNGKDDLGKYIASGLYYARLDVDADNSGRYTSIKKIILLK